MIQNSKNELHTMPFQKQMTHIFRKKLYKMLEYTVLLITDLYSGSYGLRKAKALTQYRDKKGNRPEKC